MDEQDLFELLFGPTAHPEMLKRSARVAKFLYSNAQLTRGHMDRLWESASCKHEAHRNAVFSLIQDIAFAFSSADVSYLIDKVSAVPYSQVDASVLGLLKEFARQLSNWRLPKTVHYLPSLKHEEIPHDPTIASAWDEVLVDPAPPVYIHFNTENATERPTGEGTELTEGLEVARALEYL